MRTSTLVLAAASVFTASAFPVASSTKSSSSSLPTGGASEPYDWSAGYASDFNIHSSCNATERHQLEFALSETVELARHAKEHILVQGSNSKIYKKYFGSSPTAPVIGWLEKLVSGNREGIVFRCDDPDKNCETQDGWNGHHRGSNATMETVICPLSYTSRLPLTKLCTGGFEIATGKIASYFAADLMHRLFHVPTIGENAAEGPETGVGHHADTYAEMLELVRGENASLSTSNSASLYYFATEVYAFDIAVPGEGCVGKAPSDHGDHDHDDVTSTSSAVASPTSTTAAEVTSAAAEATTTAEAAPAGTTASEKEKEQHKGDCHTHDDGVVHCT